MVYRCYFVVFQEDLRLQSSIIIIFRDCAYVRTSEQSRTVEYTRLEYRRKIRYITRKTRYKIQTGEKSGATGEKSDISGEKFGIDTVGFTQASFNTMRFKGRDSASGKDRELSIIRPGATTVVAP
jgi:hypothetical protein